MVNVRIVPALLTCVGKKEGRRYLPPSADVIYPPNTDMVVKCDAHTRAIVSVPVVYREVSAKMDAPRFELQLRSPRSGWRGAAHLSLADEVSHPDRFTGSLDVELPYSSDSYSCRFYTGVVQRPWSAAEPGAKAVEGVSTFEEGVARVEVQRVSGHLFECPFCHASPSDVVLLGMRSQSPIALPQEVFDEFLADFHKRHEPWPDFWAQVEKRLNASTDLVGTGRAIE